MAAENDVRSLHALVGSFHLRERAIVRAHEEMTRLLASGEPDAMQIARYTAAVHRYFQGFAREAREHLEDVDKRLGRVSQVQFNLAAERGVTVKRLDAVRDVLDRLGDVAG